MTETARSTRRSVEFTHGFVLNTGDEPLPPGLYEVETEEELIPNLSFQAYRRVRTTLTSQAGQKGATLQRQVHTIEPAALEAALALDRARNQEDEANSAETAADGGVRAQMPKPGKAASIQTKPMSSRNPMGQFQKHNLISTAPLTVPLLIVAGLVIITWYRPVTPATPAATSTPAAASSPSAR
jgi:hypothetical protein